MIRLLAVALLAAACGQAKEQPKAKAGPPAAIVEKLHTVLAKAREETTNYFSGENLPGGFDVRELVEGSRARWWEKLSPVETFLLFELSPETAARAPIEVRAKAYCAGVEHINAEWWGMPGSTSEDPQKRLLAIGMPVTKCLVKLFDSTRKIGYLDGEANTSADDYAWTVADLAAGSVANIVGASYDAEAAPATRAANRTLLRAKLP